MTTINKEIDTSRLVLDTRSAEEKFFSWLYRPDVFRNFLVCSIALLFYQPFLFPIWILALWLLIMGFQDRRFVMPLRMPKDVGGLDKTDFIETVSKRTYRKAGGILYLGFQRIEGPQRFDQGRELWLTNSDARTHAFIAGTTGSGKTEALIGVYYNALCWGSGCCYGDGKADSDLAFSLWSLSRRLGMEDNFLILNYLTGGTDPFEQMVAREAGKLSAYLPQSNSMNPVADGSADFLLQLIASLLPKAGGDAAQWQEKALNMIDALLRILCYKRARGEIDTSIGVIRHYLAIQNMVEFYLAGKRGEIPELAYLPIKTYFETGLPGFNPALADDPSKWDPEVYNQHGYLTSQFSRTLAMLMDTYGYIFGDKYPAIDMLDVLLSNRILLVMIPSLEKSASEAAALGKLYVSSVRLMMAQSLGYRLEGTKQDVLDSKATNSPCPSIIINDELAYYFASGIAVMFAQARGLGFMMIAAVQDKQGLDRGEAREEAPSMIANTKIKWVLALEDAEATFDMIKKAGGEAAYSTISGHEATIGTFSTTYSSQATASIEHRSRIDLRKLKSMNSGQSILLFKDAAVDTQTFYIPDEKKKTTKLSAHINRFIQIERPRYERLPSSAERLATDKTPLSSNVRAIIAKGNLPTYMTLDDPVLSVVVNTANRINNISRITVSPEQRGGLLFAAARKAMHTARNQSQYSEHLHTGKYVDPDVLDISDLGDFDDYDEEDEE